MGEAAGWGGWRKGEPGRALGRPLSGASAPKHTGRNAAHTHAPTMHTHTSDWLRGTVPPKCRTQRWEATANPVWTAPEVCCTNRSLPHLFHAVRGAYNRVHTHIHTPRAVYVSLICSRAGYRYACCPPKFATPCSNRSECGAHTRVRRRQPAPAQHVGRHRGRWCVAALFEGHPRARARPANEHRVTHPPSPQPRPAVNRGGSPTPR